MAETEKITINLSVVDLGQIDLLVEQGLYSNRTDLIRTAVRNQINKHTDVVQQTVTRKTLVVGILIFSRSDLEKQLAKEEMIEIKIVGMLILHKDIPVELALQTIKSIKVYGSFKASRELQEALADRIFNP